MSAGISEAGVLATVRQALAENLAGMEINSGRSFTGSGGTSVQALMIVDDILAALALDDYLADKIMSSLMLVPSLDAFPARVLATLRSHGVV